MAFSFNKEQMAPMIDGKSKSELEKLGGIKGLQEGLVTDLTNGLDAKDFEERRKRYGRNVLQHKEPATFIELVMDGLQDKTLIMLCIASFVSLILGIKENPTSGWIEGAAILAAVAVVVLVGAINTYQKEKQFRALNAKKEDKSVKVTRQGVQQQISTFELLVGDVLTVETGDILPADGVFINGHGIKCDESGNTGESDAISKPEDDPFFLSGSQVIEGYGSMLVVAVGENSMHGRTISSMQVESEDTPLQRKLDQLADNIGKLGIGMAVLTLVLLTTKHIIVSGDYSFSELFSAFIKYLITSITMLVVAVPEGLPLAVTISLAYSMKKMLKDNNLVRHLAACETMGGATTICSDKTGTLTQNRMTVVKGKISGIEFNEVDSLKGSIPSHSQQVLFESVSVNSTAYEGVNASGVQEFIGNKTESALLGLNKKLGADYKKIRNDAKVEQLIPFSSARKSMAVVIETSTGYRAHVKGASEIVLSHCTKQLNNKGEVVNITEGDRKGMESYIKSLAEGALRTICIAYRDTKEKPSDWEKFAYAELVLIGIMGIQDPLRPEVKDAVAACKKAGIVVRMVTGDNVVTAQNIAKNCGIITENDGSIVMEGPKFRDLDDSEMDEIVPKLRVLARSSPLDKQILVAKLKEMGEIVAVTGDGTNDGPALKLANVGFSMGIAGTEIAKEASDIILMDDNFNSIVKAVMWGRNVYDSIRKFLQFQLTVNIVAVSLAFIGSLISGHGESPLKPVQLLWVNLIMDTMAALALSTEEPTLELLNRKPYGKDGSGLITNKMWKSVIGQAIFQLIVNLGLLYAVPSLFGIERDSTKHLTIFFNTFVICQVFNEINSRKINDELNVFQGFFANGTFLMIIIFTLIMQYVLVQFGGEFVSTTPLTGQEWLFCIGIGSLGLPVGFLIRLIPISEPAPVEPPKPVRPPKEKVSAKEKWNKAFQTVRRTNSVLTTLLNTKKKRSTQEKWRDAINSVHYQASIVKFLRKDRLKREQTIPVSNTQRSDSTKQD